METVINPIGRLQEDYQSLGVPSYITLGFTGASHAPTFTIQVTLGDLNAMANGSSKKVAKHGAAQAMLHLLKQTKPNQTTTPSPDQSSISDATQKVQQTLVSGNCVGALQELCTKRFLPLPKYDLEHRPGCLHLGGLLVPSHPHLPPVLDHT